MSEQKFPPGWSEERVQKLLAHYEQIGDDELVAEDEAAAELAGQTIMVIPTEFVEEVRQLIKRKSSA